METGSLPIDQSPDIKVTRYWFAAACTAGMAVVTDLSTTTTTTGNTLAVGSFAKKSPATADLPGVLGYLVNTVTAGSWGDVQQSGVMTGVTCNAAVVAGDALCTEATAGSSRTYVAGTDGNKTATALTSYSGGTCTVLIGR